MIIEQGNQQQGPADTTTTTPAPSTDNAPPADKGMSLRENLEANLELSEKGEQSPDLSTAARTLAGARKGKPAPIDKLDDKTLADSERVAKENAEKAKRSAELAAMAPEERAKVEAEDKRKAEEAAAASSIEAPAHWPAADREMFSKQSPEAKKWLLGRHKALEADYTKKTQEIGSFRREQEELDDIFKPWKQDMELGGITRVMAVRQLAAAHKRLQEDPAGALRWLAEQYAPGKDPKALFEGAAAADPAGESPTVKALRTQVESLTGQLTRLTGAQDQQQHNAVTSQVQQFADEKDAQGKLIRPYFDDVAKDVAALIRVAREGGETITLQDAYDRAVYANPTVRQKVLAAQDAERRTKEEAERKKKAEEAKRAGFDVKGEGAAAAGAATTNSLRESLERAWDAQEGRV